MKLDTLHFTSFQLTNFSDEVNVLVDFGNPGGGWRKIVLRGVLRGGGVDQALRGGGGFVLVSQVVSKASYRSMGTTGDPVPVGQRDVPVNHFTG